MFYVQSTLAVYRGDLKNMDRDYFLTPEEAKEFGIILWSYVLKTNVFG